MSNLRFFALTLFLSLLSLGHAASAHAQLLYFPPQGMPPGWGSPIFQPGWHPAPGWGYPQQPPQAPYIPGFSRAECVNFDFHGVRPSAMLKIRIERTDPYNRKVLYQRALFVLKFETDPLIKGTADWMRLQIESIKP